MLAMDIRLQRGVCLRNRRADRHDLEAYEITLIQLQANRIVYGQRFA
jgi:hypothetical protein